MIVLAVIAGIVWIALPSLHLVGDWIAGAVQYFFDWLRSITPEPA
ncbi:hypothetical protein GCM10023351_21640 [Microbacterium gilvum]|uniref:Uncharacterized protein n=2 Tax=Microbacterium gilvum TaxID=1336204 RepID=A0ABP9AA87_9MICO